METKLQADGRVDGLLYFQGGREGGASAREHSRAFTCGNYGFACQTTSCFHRRAPIQRKTPLSAEK